MDVSVSAPLSATTPNSATSSGSQAKLEKTSSEESAQHSQQEQQQIQKLKTRDRVVRAHEAAHLAAGAGIVKGGATFSFQRGPDGVQYAIGGEVQIDASKVAGDPQATAQKADRIRAAALAPVQPSSTDQAVAARAAQMAVEARAEISQQRNAELDKSTENNDDASTNTINSFTSPEPTGNLLDFTA
jgi:SprA family protein